jgi:hypothetical protein
VSRGQRLVLLGLAAVVAVAAFVVLGPLSGEREPAQRAGGSTDTARDGSASPSGDPAPSQPKPRYTVVRVEGGKPVGGVQEVEVESGDTVRLAIRSDRRDEVHIHGYDRYVQVGPKRSGKVRFRADLEGVYEIELHSDSTQIASLRVEP